MSAEVRLQSTRVLQDPAENQQVTPVQQCCYKCPVRGQRRVVKHIKRENGDLVRALQQKPSTDLNEV